MTYPIKSALVEMYHDGDINIDDDLTRACVSWFAIKVATVGTASFVEAWNNHSIPGANNKQFCSPS